MTTQDLETAKNEDLMDVVLYVEAMRDVIEHGRASSANMLSFVATNCNGKRIVMGQEWTN
jgi:hypothetical protein